MDDNQTMAELHALIEHYGSRYAVGPKIGVTAGAVTYWLKRGAVSPRRVVAIRRANADIQGKQPASERRKASKEARAALARDLIAKAAGAGPAARLLGVPYAHMYAWQIQGVPRARVADVERILSEVETMETPDFSEKASKRGPVIPPVANQSA